MPETREKALETLLHELFDADEFRVFLRGLPGGEKLIAALPGKEATTELLFSAAVGVLERRRHLDGDFFTALADERPKGKTKIVRVARLWEAENVVLPEPAHAPRGTRRLQTSHRRPPEDGLDHESTRTVLRAARVDLTGIGAVEVEFQESFERLHSRYDGEISDVAVSSIFRSCQEHFKRGLHTPRSQIKSRKPQGAFRAMLESQVIPKLLELELVKIEVPTSFEIRVVVTRAGKAYLRWDRAHL